ncbi:MAG: hypothetical protein QM662_12185 [Gordonia sp. (in: high G+C Gram-positive bacteria)]
MTDIPKTPDAGQPGPRGRPLPPGPRRPGLPRAPDRPSAALPRRPGPVRRPGAVHHPGAPRLGRPVVGSPSAAVPTPPEPPPTGPKPFTVVVVDRRAEGAADGGSAPPWQIGAAVRVRTIGIAVVIAAQLAWIGWLLVLGSRDTIVRVSEKLAITPTAQLVVSSVVIVVAIGDGLLTLRFRRGSRAAHRYLVVTQFLALVAGVPILGLVGLALITAIHEAELARGNIAILLVLGLLVTVFGAVVFGVYLLGNRATRQYVADDARRRRADDEGSAETAKPELPSQ